MAEIIEIPIGKIQVGEHEQRLYKEDEGIEDLARSISRLGLLVPLHVQCLGGFYQVVCGHRRLRAARKTSLEKLPCIVLDDKEGKEEEISFAENFFRRDLSPIELAAAIKDCIEREDMGIEELAKALNRSPYWLGRMRAMCEWPEDLQEAIHNEQISVAAGSNLALVTDGSYRNFLVRNAVEQGATARTTASWLQAWRAMQPQEEAITAEPVPGASHAVPLCPQAPCLCCGQVFNVNELSHVPVCGACVQIIRQVGMSQGV